jgi:predicted kinase
MDGALAIDLPDPCLVVLIGAAGVGKSTFAVRHFRTDEILSSDAFRAAISGDEANQSATGPAFAALHRALDGRSADGRLTVVDATSVRAADRRALLRRAGAAGLPSVAIVLDLPADTIHARNAARSRIVDAAVIDRQLDQLRRSLAGPDRAIDREGFAEIIVLDDADRVDQVIIRRRR